MLIPMIETHVDHLFVDNDNSDNGNENNAMELSSISLEGRIMPKGRDTCSGTFAKSVKECWFHHALDGLQ